MNTQRRASLGLAPVDTDPFFEMNKAPRSNGGTPGQVQSYDWQYHQERVDRHLILCFLIGLSGCVPLACTAVDAQHCKAGSDRIPLCAVVWEAATAFHVASCHEVHNLQRGAVICRTLRKMQMILCCHAASAPTKSAAASSWLRKVS